MPSSANTGRDSEKFNLRLPDGMRDRIAAAAAESGRSMNSEIVARLEASFSGADRRWTDEDLMEMATQLAEMLQKGAANRSRRPPANE